MHNAEVHHSALHFNEMPSCTEAVLVIWCSPVHFRAVPVVEVVVLVGFSPLCSASGGGGVEGSPVQDAVDAKCTDLDIASRVNENFLISNT